MNFFVLKYCLLIGAILTSTAVVAGPLNPQKIFSNSSSSLEDSGQISADSLYQFGSSVFYKEIAKPGNEYLNNSVAGYSQNLIQTNDEEQQYSDLWPQGVAVFKAGYQDTTDAYFQLAAVPDMQSTTQQNEVCDKFQLASEEIQESESIFTSAKGSSSLSSANGFTIGMVLARVDPIRQQSENAQQSCMKAVLADQNGDSKGFLTNFQDVETDVKEMNRIYPELKVLSNDFD
jgi:hypothetical protein